MRRRPRRAPRCRLPGKWRQTNPRRKPAPGRTCFPAGAEAPAGADEGAPTSKAAADAETPGSSDDRAAELPRPDAGSPDPDAEQPASGSEDAPDPAPQTGAGAAALAGAEAPAGSGEGAATAKAAAEAEAPGSEDTAPELPQPDAGSPAPTLDEEAADYVANLAKPSSDPIPGESASHFVGADQEIRFGSADEAAPLGSTQQLAAATEPEAPPGVPPAEAEARIPKADAESTVGKAGPTDARDDPAKTAGDPAATPSETRVATGAEPPGENRTATPATERREKPGSKPGDRGSVAGKPDGGEPVSGPAPTGAGKDGAAPKTEAPVRKPGAAAAPAEDRTATGAEPSKEDRTETPAADPGNTPGDREPVAGESDAGEPASDGATPTDARKDAPPPPTTAPVKRTEAAATAPAEARTATGAGPSGKDRTETPATAPMKRADDDIGELLSGTAPAVAREDEAPPPAGAPAKKPQAAAAAEPAPEAVPEAAGKSPAEAARAETGASRNPGEPPAPRETITIRDVLAGVVEFGEDDVFYIHAVTPGDDQGLWGIIQEAVIGNFARGVRLTLGERTDTYRVAVPKDADELLDDRSSSPFGLMIHRKSQKTIVYNRRLGRLTQDPDVTLYPGNEIIIVGFEPEELIRLYKHFAGADGG